MNHTDLWSFTAPANGTAWGENYTTILVTCYRDDTGGRIVQVVPVSKSSIRMLEYNGVMRFDPLAPAVLAAINNFEKANTKHLMQRVHEKWSQEEALLRVGRAVQ